jgi:hypothetical protein
VAPPSDRSRHIKEVLRSVYESRLRGKYQELSRAPPSSRVKKRVGSWPCLARDTAFHSLQPVSYPQITYLSYLSASHKQTRFPTLLPLWKISDTRYFQKDLITELSFWKVDSKEYVYKKLKNQGYLALLGICKTFDPSANKDYVCKIIQSLRGSFQK